VRSCAGKSLRIPAITKNIPVSNSTDIKCVSMSPVATGKLSKLSNCINGENTAISTISMSTTLGNLLGILFLYRTLRRRISALVLGRLRDYSTMTTVRKILQVACGSRRKTRRVCLVPKLLIIKIFSSFQTPYRASRCLEIVLDFLTKYVTLVTFSIFFSSLAATILLRVSCLSGVALCRTLPTCGGCVLRSVRPSYGVGSSREGERESEWGNSPFSRVSNALERASYQGPVPVGAWQLQSSCRGATAAQIQLLH